MTDTTTIPRGTPCGRTVLLTGAGVAAAGGAIAFVIDHSATILNGIFLAVTFGHFWPGVIVHFAAAMLCAYAVCKLSAGAHRGRFGSLLAGAVALYFASLFSVTDLAAGPADLTVYQTTAMWILWLGFAGVCLAIVGTFLPDPSDY